MIEHVGSTSIPDLVAKDVIDVQIRVPELDTELLIGRFTVAGYRHRPEPWNNLEATRLGVYPKLVFAPPLGARHANVHTRAHDSPGAYDTLLFRDYLRAEEAPRRSWGDLKQSIVQGKDVDFATYGQAKQLAWADLMTEADQWALEHEWRPRLLVPWSTLS
jgi:dephospho-CoA kinase